MNLDHQIFTAIEGFLSDESITLYRASEIDESRVEPPAVIYGSVDYPRQDVSGDRVRLYPVNIPIRVVYNTGQAYLPSAEGALDAMVDNVVDALDRKTPSLTAPLTASELVVTVESGPDTTQSRVSRTVLCRLGIYKGYPAAPLSGSDASLAISGFNDGLIVTGWTVSRDGPRHTDFTGAGDSVRQVRLGSPIGFVRIFAEVTGPSVKFPQWDTRVTTTFTVDADGGETFNEEVLYGRVDWTPMGSDPTAAQRVVIEGIIDNEDSPIFTGEIEE